MFSSYLLIVIFHLWDWLVYKIWSYRQSIKIRNAQYFFPFIVLLIYYIIVLSIIHFHYFAYVFSSSLIFIVICTPSFVSNWRIVFELSLIVLSFILNLFYLSFRFDSHIAWIFCSLLYLIWLALGEVFSLFMHRVLFLLFGFIALQL